MTSADASMSSCSHALVSQWIALHNTTQYTPAEAPSIVQYGKLLFLQVHGERWWSIHHSCKQKIATAATSSVLTGRRKLTHQMGLYSSNARHGPHTIMPCTSVWTRFTHKGRRERDESRRIGCCEMSYMSTMSMSFMRLSPCHDFRMS